MSFASARARVASLFSMAPKYSNISSALPATRSRLVDFWREGSLQAGKDWRARWKPAALWLLAFIWILGLILTLAIISGLSGSRDYTLSSACQPDGSFSVDPSSYQYWSKSGFFQITLGFGNLSFTQAKAIDIIWDVLFGHGGQALLTLISWRVFANYVTTSMEVRPVTFRTYRMVFMQNGSLLVGIPRMIRDFTFRHGLHSKIAMVFMIITMAFILSFPTFGSAMTGYSGNVKAFLSTTDSQLIPFEDFEFAIYTIHDAQRIGQNNDYVVADNSTSGDPVLYDGDWSDGAYYNGYGNMITRVTSYVSIYGFNGSNNISSIFGNITLPSPALNISATYIPQRLKRIYNIDINLFADKSQMAWVHGDMVYNIDKMRQHGSCQALLDYKWGFSYIQLALMNIFLIIWSFGIFIMWLRSHIIMKKRNNRDVAGEYKAIFEIADAMRSQLEEHGKEEGLDISALPEATLHRRITKDLRGGTISYETSLLSSGEDGKGDSEWGYRLWVKKERWWITGSLLSLGVLLVVTMLVNVFNSIALYGLLLAIIFAMYIGSTNKSRGIILFWVFVGLGVIPQIIIAILLGAG